MFKGSDLQRPGRIAWKVWNILGLIFIADFLFYDHHIGWTASLFALCLVLSHLVHNAKRLNRNAWLFIALCFGMVAALAENPSALAVIMFWTSFIASIIAVQMHGVEDLKRWVSSALKLMFFPIGPVAKSLMAYNRLHQSKVQDGQAYKLFQRWAVPITLSLVFITLFAFANPIISNWFSDIQWGNVTHLLSPLRWLFWLFILCIGWTFIRPKLRSKRLKSPHSLSKTENASGFASHQSIVTSLILFNLIFFIQTLMDLYYLWGGAALPNDLTYAEYAHRGAYPLIFTALLAAVFVLATLKPGTKTERDAKVRTLVLIWVAQNVVLVVSSIWRTTLYIEEYSLTYLRVAALIWMGLVAIGLLFIIARIYMRRNNEWLLLANAGTAFLALYICCFLNFADIIARYNVAHSYELAGHGSSLDVYYLIELGPDALPALNEFSNRGGTFNYQPYYSNQSVDPRIALTKQMNKEWQDWRARTFRLYRLKNHLNNEQSRASSNKSP